MASVSFTLPAPIIWTDVAGEERLQWDNLSGLQIPNSLLPAAATRYLRRLGLSSSNTVLNSTLYVSTTDSGSGFSNGQDLSDAWETSAVAIKLSYGGSELVVKGPNHPDNDTRDSSEAYFFRPNAADRATIAAWIAGLGGAVSGIVLTLDDGALPDADAPTVTIDAVAAGDEGTTVSLSATLGTGDDAGTYDTLEYAWSVSGGSLNNSDSASPTWTRPAVIADTNFNVDLTVTAKGTGTNAADGTSDSANAARVVATVRNVIVLPAADAPAVTIDPVADGDENTTAPLSASLSGGTYDELAYAWTVSHGSLDDAAAAGPTWTRPSVTADTRADINLTVTAGGTGANARIGTSDTASAAQVSTTVRNLLVLPNADAPNVSIASVSSVDEDATQTLSASVTGGTYDTLAYVWAVDSGGGTISGSGASVTYAPPNVSADTSVTVRVTVTAEGTGGVARDRTSDAAVDTETFTVDHVPATTPEGLLGESRRHYARAREFAARSAFQRLRGDGAAAGSLRSQAQAEITALGNVSTDAGAAVHTASAALTAANSALSAANTAVQTAQSAVTAAQSSANSAQSTFETAFDAALASPDVGLAAAILAKNTARTALNNAVGALTDRLTDLANAYADQGAARARRIIATADLARGRTVDGIITGLVAEADELL